MQVSYIPQFSYLTLAAQQAIATSAGAKKSSKESETFRKLGGDFVKDFWDDWPIVFGGFGLGLATGGFVKNTLLREILPFIGVAIVKIFSDYWKSIKKQQLDAFLASVAKRHPVHLVY